MTAVPPAAPAETDTRAIEATVRDYFEGWCHAHVQLVRTSAGWGIANALWQPSAE